MNHVYPQPFSHEPLAVRAATAMGAATGQYFSNGMNGILPRGKTYIGATIRSRLGSRATGYNQGDGFVEVDYEPRPMTSVTGAGYQSDPSNDGSKSARSNPLFDPLNQNIKFGRKRSSILSNKKEKSNEDIIKELETDIHKVLEESALKLCSCDDIKELETNKIQGLEKAKEAAKKERAMMKNGENKGLKDHPNNIELTFAVWFHLAHAYIKNEMNVEAISTYSFMIKKKLYPSSASVRLRVNMGNIYYKEKQYSKALKMYRMALDRLPSSEKEIGYKICRNIGNSLFHLGRFRDAIQSFESVMNTAPNYRTGFNLILCYLSLDDAEKMKRGFSKLLTVPVINWDKDKDTEDANKIDEKYEITDMLSEEIKKRKKEMKYYILRSARLIAPSLDKQSWINGYQWVYDQLININEQIACHIKMEIALQHLRRKEIGCAVNILKSFEKKDPWAKAMAATNLSFIYFLEGNYETSSTFAKMAVKNTRYNSKALVNRGNCCYVVNEFEQAKEIYMEAIGIQPNCIEALVNIGLTNIQLGRFDEALHALHKANTILPNNPIVLYQIAFIHENQNQLKHAIKAFNLLISCVPTDPSVLSRMGNILCMNNDESQGFHFQLESYRHYPTDLDVISWLGVWFVKHEMYEKSIHFFNRASQLEPDEIKWHLMINSCYRRMGYYSRALQLYKKLHRKYPKNIECMFIVFRSCRMELSIKTQLMLLFIFFKFTSGLRYLISICKDMNNPCDEYEEELFILENKPITNYSKIDTKSRDNSIRDYARTDEKPIVYETEERWEGISNKTMIDSNQSTSSQKSDPDLKMEQEKILIEKDDNNFSDEDVNELLA